MNYSLGRLDYSKLPSYLRNDYDADGLNITGQKPYATLWGKQLGLDNNYNYAVTPDGSVQQLFYGTDPNYNPTEDYSGTGANTSIKTAQQLGEEYGWDYQNAPRDAHGYALPGDLGGLRYSPYTNPGTHSGGGIWEALPGIAFSLMAGGIGGLAAGAAGIGGGAASAFSGAVGGGMSAGAAGGNPFIGAAKGALGGSSGSVLGGGDTDVLSAAGGTGGSTTGAASGGAGMWDWLDDIGLDEYGNSNGSFQGGSGDYFDPMANDPLAGIPNDTGWDFGPDMGNKPITDNPVLEPTYNPLEWAKYPANGIGNYLRFLTGGSPASGGLSSSGGGNGQRAGGIGSMSAGDIAFDSAPFLLSVALANKQRNDINPYLDRINALSDRFAGNESSYLHSLTDPYDMATSQQRGALTTSLGNRGVMGSSFGDMSLDNFGYMRDVGRANLLGRGINEGIGAQSQLTDQAMKAINSRNMGTNALLGAGLNASARLFAPNRDPFGLQEALRRG